MKIWILILIALLAAPLSAEETGTLVVTVKNVGSDKGEIIGYLFDDKDNWLNYERAAYKTDSAAKPGLVTLTFRDVRLNDRYALSVFHDQNGNGEMDVGSFIPMPAEPVAASNHTTNSMPRYYKCSFVLKKPETALSVTLREL